MKHYVAYHRGTKDCEIWGDVPDDLWDMHQAQLPDHQMVVATPEQFAAFREHGLHNFRMEADGEIRLKPEELRVSTRVLTVPMINPPTLARLTYEMEQMNKFFHTEFFDLLMQAIRKAFDERP